MTGRCLPLLIGFAWLACSRLGDAADVPLRGRQDAGPEIEKAIRADGLAQLPAGVFETHGPLQIDVRQVQHFAIRGAVPIAAWGIHYHAAPAPHWTTIVAKDLQPDEPWLDIDAPAGLHIGNLAFLDFAVLRDTPGPILRIRSVTAEDGHPSVRGVLLRDMAVSGPRDAHWSGEFQGKELPQPMGKLLEFNGVYDVRLQAVSAFGGETQLQMTDVDLARVVDWHGGVCARSIVFDGLTKGSIRGAVVENAIVSGVDARNAAVYDCSVEMGYGSFITPTTLPVECQWASTAGSDRVAITGVDATRWIPPQSVLVLDQAKPLYVVAVDKDGFTYARHESTCQLPTASGNGSRLTRTPTPYIIRGDSTAIDLWKANLNQGTPGVPVMALFPFSKPLHVGADLTELDKTWDWTHNRAVVGAWSAEDAPQWLKGGHVIWEASEAFRPQGGKRVFGPRYPAVDPNKGLIGAGGRQ